MKAGQVSHELRVFVHRKRARVALKDETEVHHSHRKWIAVDVITAAKMETDVDVQLALTTVATHLQLRKIKYVAKITFESCLFTSVLTRRISTKLSSISRFSETNRRNELQISEQNTNMLRFASGISDEFSFTF